jgi:hypothetical protein
MSKGHRRRQFPAKTARLRLGLSLACCLMLAGCAAPGDQASTAGGDSELATILYELREHPERREVSVLHCEESLTRKRSDFPFKSLFAGFLSVPTEDGGAAFCAALAEAAIAGELTKNDIAPFTQRPRPPGLEPLGTLLRKVLVAHLRLASRGA